VTFTPSAGNEQWGYYVLNDGSNNSFNGNGTDGILVWGADLRLTSNANTLPTYQPTTTLPTAWLGNHATAPNDSARPVLRARYNQITYSEELDNAAWTKRGTCTVTPNDAIAPNGTLTADRIDGLGSGSNDIFNADYQTVQTYGPAGTSYTPSVWVKRISTVGVFFVSNPTTLSDGQWNIDLSALPDDWVRITATTPGVTVVNAFKSSALANGGLLIRAIGGPLSFHLWGADARVTNDALNMPAYQRVGAATDYDTNGFLPYLQADGTDDGMSTSAIDFSATDKMTVFAGIRKLSDTLRGIVVELSTNAAAGSFSIQAPNPSGANAITINYAGATTPRDVAASGVVAPITSVVTGSIDLGAPLVVGRLNGVQFATNSGSTGGGNFGSTYPLFIGARNNASLFFNGRLYSLIVRGAASSASEIAATEAWVNARTGAY
jgi:hypothetical protein